MKSNQTKRNHPIDDNDFWLNASEQSLKAIWDNSEDDVYAEELTLEDLLARITKKNRHAEIDFGAPVGKEKC